MARAYTYMHRLQVAGLAQFALQRFQSLSIMFMALCLAGCVLQCKGSDGRVGGIDASLCSEHDDPTGTSLA